METNPLILEYTLNVPAAKVWQALTDVAAMKHWYFDIDSFKAEPGFAFRFTAGSPEEPFIHLCKVTRVMPGQHLAYTWRYEGYEGNTEVSFELIAEGDQTRLILTHAGLHTFPDLPAFARDNFQQGWTAIIGGNLKRYLERYVFPASGMTP